MQYFLVIAHIEPGHVFRSNPQYIGWFSLLDSLSDSCYCACLALLWNWISYNALLSSLTFRLFSAIADAFSAVEQLAKVSFLDRNRTQLTAVFLIAHSMPSSEVRGHDGVLWWPVSFGARKTWTACASETARQIVGAGEGRGQSTRSHTHERDMVGAFAMRAALCGAVHALARIRYVTNTDAQEAWSPHVWIPWRQSQSLRLHARSCQPPPQPLEATHPTRGCLMSWRPQQSAQGIVRCPVVLALFWLSGSQSQMVRSRQPLPFEPSPQDTLYPPDYSLGVVAVGS